MLRKKTMTGILRGTRLPLAVAVIGALLAPAAQAATFGINGQVFRVNTVEAADESIEDADLLLRDPLPYVKVRVVNAATRAVLGDPVWAGPTGNFAVVFEATAGDEVEVQALRVIDGDGEVLPAAREEMNTLTLSAPATAMAVRVASDEAVDLSGLETSPTDGVGILFTEVGKVEIPYICQEVCTTAATCPKICQLEEVGLADMNDAAGQARAGELHLPANASGSHYNAAFHDAPFGGGLLIFGMFGPAEPGCGDIDWYRVKYRTMTWSSGAWVFGGWDYWSQPMHKTRYEINFVPSFSADSFLEKVGPINGTANDLYRVNPLPTSPGQVVAYSFANKRMNWRTGGLADGLYEIALDYYTQVGGSDTNPTVVQLPATCVDGALPPDEANKVALNKLRLRINNQRPTISLDGIFVRSTANQYVDAARSSCSDPAPGRTGSKALALDFNAAANRCDIIELDSSVADVVEIDFKARQDAGYMRSYSLAATSNADPPDTVSFAADNYGNHAASGVLWTGLCSTNPQMPCATPGDSVVRTNATPFPQNCAYIFDLVVRTRNQNGYSYLHRPHIRRAYYVRP